MGSAHSLKSHMLERPHTHDLVRCSSSPPPPVRPSVHPSIHPSMRQPRTIILRIVLQVPLVLRRISVGRFVRCCLQPVKVVCGKRGGSFAMGEKTRLFCSLSGTQDRYRNEWYTRPLACSLQHTQDHDRAAAMYVCIYI